MTLPHRYVGCDVSKHWLDVFDSAEARPQRIANTPEATAALADRPAVTLKGIASLNKEERPSKR